MEFGLILDKSEFKTDDSKGVALTVNSEGKIVWEENKPKRQITSITGWTTAFLIFASVYLEAHPSKGQELLKYCHLIRTSSARFGGWGWKNYDIQFRLRKMRNPERSWATIDSELWAVYMGVPSTQRGFQNTPLFQRRLPSSSSQFFPVSSFPATQFQGQRRGGSPANRLQGQRGGGRATCICFDYNRNGCFRPSCIYKHQCIKCNDKAHGAASCRKFNQASTR